MGFTLNNTNQKEKKKTRSTRNKNNINHMNFKKNVQSLDFFSLPFRFTLGEEEKEKKTLFGGVLSLLITILSLSYFIYLCYLYGNNKIQPSIASTEQYTSQQFSMNLKSDFITLKINLGNDLYLLDYQQQTKKVLIHAFLQYSYEDVNQQLQTEISLGVTCSASGQEDYICFNLPSFKNGIPLTFKQNKSINDPLMLIISQCSTQFLQAGETCETDQSVIKNLILGMNAQVEVFFDLNQYNTVTKDFNSNQRVEAYTLDPTISFFSKISLQKSDLTVIDGFIIQRSVSTRFLSGFSRADSAITSTFISTQLGVNFYGGISLNLSPNNLSIHIQFVQFTQVLAQFSSIFNSLLFLGFFSKLLAESEIAQEMISVQLKYYYKFTALQLISLQNNKPNKEKEQNNKQLPNSQASQLLNNFKKILNLDFKQSVSKQLHISFPRRIYSYFFQSNTAPKDSPELRVYKQLQQQASNALNIFQLQKEILTLKVMLRMILSPEQFAAALLCGSNLPKDCHLKSIAPNKPTTRQITPAKKNPAIDSELLFFPKQINEKQVEEKVSMKSNNQSIIEIQEEQPEETHLNHLEQIDQIETNPLVQEQYLLRFLSSKNNSEIDIRILQCMILLNPPDSFQPQLDIAEKKIIPPQMSDTPRIDSPQELIKF